MPSTTPTSPSSAKIATSAPSSASPEPAAAPDRALVAIGGGTGLSALLRGLKHYAGTARLRQLTGVVTVTDDGGSSGRLRREFGVLPPGDIRNCIAALADDEDLLTRLFQYRFPNGGGLLGHSFGNLFLTALTGITGDFHQAILTAESVLSVRGKVFPATVNDVRLRAVGVSGEKLDAVEIDPHAPPAFPPAVAALETADLILLGPGSLYTSILPNLLIPGIRQALARSKARVVLLLNLMTQPGETDRMMGIDHLNALVRHAGDGVIDAVLVNSTAIPAALISHYAGTYSEPVAVDRAALEAVGVEVHEADLLAADGDLIRHDSEKLAAAVLGLTESVKAVV